MKGIIRLILFVVPFFGYAADIAVVSMAIGEEYQEAVAQGIESKRTYCEKHGYDFVYETEWLDPSRPFAWSKIKLLQKVLDSGKYKWVFWSDADSLIMNHAVKLEEFIKEEYDVILSTNYDGTEKRLIINTGQFFLKSSDWNRAFLKKVYTRTEFLNHYWWEQKAIIDEYEKDITVQQHFYIYPPRMLNSKEKDDFVDQSELHRVNRIFYEKGDFIIHFYGRRNLKEITHLMDKYSKLVVDNRKVCDLDHFLGMHGYFVSARNARRSYHLPTVQQKKQFHTSLSRLGKIENVLLIGLYGGHSAEFFINTLNLKKLVAVDCQEPVYTNIGLDYLKRNYCDRVNYIHGEIDAVLGKKTQHQIPSKFDLIYISKRLGYDEIINHILSCSQIATHKTSLWIDDYYRPEVRRAIQELVQERRIRIVERYNSEDQILGRRSWVELKYCD